MTSCERWERDLALHASGDLAPERAARLEAHLGECGACSEQLSRYERDREALEGLAHVPLAEDALARVRTGVRGRLPVSSGRRAAWGLRWVVATAAAVSVVAILVATLLVRAPARGPRAVLHRARLPKPAAVAEDRSQVDERAAVAAPSPGTPPRRRAAAQAPTLEARPARVEAPTLSPDEADQLVRALVYVSQLDRLPRPDEEEPQEPSVPAAQLARFETDDPNVVIYWLMDSNGGSP